MTEPRTESDIRSSIDALMNTEEEITQEEEAIVEDESPITDDALEEVTSESEDGQEDESEDTEEIAGTLDAKKMAEKLGVDVEEIYKMQFNYGDDGESMTLGELKDLGAKVGQFDDEVERLEVKQEEFSNQQLKTRAEMQSIISMLPNVTPELVKAAQEQHRLARIRESSALLEALPEWNDPAVQAKGKENIRAMTSEYGFSKSEMDQMLDHRLVKMMSDYTKLKQKVAKPAAQIQKMLNRKNKRPVSSKDKREKVRNRAKAQKDPRAKINALFED